MVDPNNARDAQEPDGNNPWGEGYLQNVPEFDPDSANRLVAEARQRVSDDAAELDDGKLDSLALARLGKNPNGDSIIDSEALQNETAKYLAERMIITTAEDADYLASAGSQIQIVPGLAVSKDLCLRAVTNDAYAEIARKFVDGEIGNLSVVKMANGDVMGGTRINKVSRLAKGLSKMKAAGEFADLNEQEQERLDYILNTTSFDTFSEKIRDKELDISLDRREARIPVSDMVAFLEIPAAQLEEMRNEKQPFKGFSLEEMSYATISYFKNSEDFAHYVMPDELSERMSLLGSQKIIDSEAINKHLKTSDKLVEKAEISSNLEAMILDGLPDDASDLEKALYTYVKICKSLTYDSRYFAANQTGTFTEKHRSLDYLPEITPENNEVVCFEFNMIYAKMLDKYGIHFESDYSSMIGESYGSVHANLEFRADKFIVEADSVSSILEGDLALAKMNQPLVGLKCLNKNEQTRQEFQDALAKMYDLVNQQEADKSSSNELMELKKLEEYLAEYERVSDNREAVSFADKSQILLDKMQQVQTRGIDSLSYLLKLRKVLFTQEERKNNASVVILRNNQPANASEGDIEAGAVITLNPKGFDESPDDTIYFYYSKAGSMEQLSHQEVQEKIHQGVFEYVEKKSPRIPNTTDRKEEK